MNFFKVNSTVIQLPGFFIVFYLAAVRFVEADLNLPNKDRLGALSCVRDFFGEEYNPKFVTEDENALSDGEYLGVLCEDLSLEDFKQILYKETQKTYDYDGEKIETCLKEKNFETSFEKYRKIGVDFLNDDAKKKKEAASAENSEERSPEFADLLSSRIFAFFNGICRTKEETEFEAVKGEAEKQEILSCLVRCTGKFMQRIQNILELGKTEAIGLLNVKIAKISATKVDQSRADRQLEEEENQKKEIGEQIKNLKDNAKISKSWKLFDDEYEKSRKTKDIRLLEKIGLPYLTNYAEFYNHINEYINNYDKKTDNGLGNLHNNVYAGFSIYQNCSTIECGMTLNSTPLYNIIREGAKDPDRHQVSKIRFDYIKAVAEENGWYTSTKRAFFKALLNIENSGS